jgi:hypothetical protein
MYPISYESLQKSLPNNHVSLQQSTANGTDTRRLTDSFMSVINISHPKLNLYSPPLPHSFYNLSSCDSYIVTFPLDSLSYHAYVFEWELCIWSPVKLLYRYIYLYTAWAIHSCQHRRCQKPCMLKILNPSWHPLHPFILPESVASSECTIIYLNENIPSYTSLYKTPYGVPSWNITSAFVGKQLAVSISVDLVMGAWVVSIRVCPIV